MPVSPETLADLTGPTPAEEVKQKPTFRKGADGRSVPTGKTLSYVDARYVMDTLDKVVGPENWSDRYVPLAGGAVECTLSINVWSDFTKEADGTLGASSGHWISKADVGVPSSIEPQKGAYSDAFKRAAVKWGIAKDLYDERADEQAAPANAGPVRGRTELDVDADAPRTNTGQRAGTRAPARGGNDAASKRARNEEEYEAFLQTWDPNDSPWYCPVHGGVELKPFGTSRAGNEYGAFLACPEGRDCDEKPVYINTIK
jgi:hypothetical protein